ncbi:MAG: RNA pyrophosphohydrolase [Alphaproteobacteria bacterium]|nr:RNA pyrophosphohydrolase [Alphaproteobacteria bacterium]
MSNLYRKNVGIVVFNQDKKVLMCARAEKEENNWQFPQGGMEAEEDVLTAAKRELQEETALTSVKVVAQFPYALKYDFPEDVRQKFAQLGCYYKGQEQYWVLLYFDGKNEEIDFFTNPLEIEFKDYKWEDIEKAPLEIVEFKKNVYEKIADFFAPIISKYEVEKND